MPPLGHLSRRWNAFPSISGRGAESGIYEIASFERRAFSEADDTSADVDFWQSSLGQLRKEFLASCSLPSLPAPAHVSSWAVAAKIVPHQVQRDIEQLEYIVSKGVLDSDLERYINDLALPEFREVLVVARDELDGQDDAYLVVEPQEDYAVFFGLHGRAIHVHPGGSIADEVIRDARDLEEAEREYLQSEHRVAVIDDFLTQKALQRLRDVLLESTIWAEAKPGYVGTYLHTGFACPLVAQIDRELRVKLPHVLGGLELEDAWAYMYDGTLGGVGTHADDSQVQVNLFVTPTEANLWAADGDEPTGGLVIYGIGPQTDWDFDAYNSLQEDPRIEPVLASIDHWNTTVPYVQNRAILFDSTYFHKTDSMSFRTGYTNRRINVTFLYGRRDKLVAAAAVRTPLNP